MENERSNYFFLVSRSGVTSGVSIDIVKASVLIVLKFGREPS